MNKIIVSMLLPVALIFSGMGLICPAYADEEEYSVNLTELYEIWNDPAALDRGTHAVSDSDIDGEHATPQIEEAVKAIRRGPNIQEIFLFMLDLELGADFFNSLATNADSLMIIGSLSLLAVIGVVATVTHFAARSKRKQKHLTTTKAKASASVILERDAFSFLLPAKKTSLAGIGFIRRLLHSECDRFVIRVSRLVCC